MSSKRPWIYGAGGALLATAATITAFALVSNGDSSRDNTGPSTPPSSTPTEPSPSPTDGTPDETFTVATYYLGNTGRGPQLYRVFQPADGPDIGSAAVTSALRPPAEGGSYNTPWEGLATSAKVSGNADLVTIDLQVSDLDALQTSSDDTTASLALEQLMRTAQGALQVGRAPVQFLANGKHVNEIRGVATSEPLANAPDSDVLAHVWIDSPANGDSVTAGTKVTGLALSFEATVTWEISKDGKVVKRGFTTAADGTTMSAFSFKLPDLPAGTYQLVVQEDDPSGGEGAGPDHDQRDIVYP